MLSNAIKFSPEKQSIEITIKETQQKSKQSDSLENYLQFSIRDHGKGISENEINQIFDKFVQGSDEVVGTTKGTGLGLSICYEIIKLHHGKIWAENHPDGGAILNFLLPVKQSN